MRRCVNDPAWAVSTAQATGMCEACLGCTAQAQKEEKDRWNLGFFCMGNGITVCNRVGVGSEWPMVAHIRYNREVNPPGGRNSQRPFAHGAAAHRRAPAQGGPPHAR